MKAAVDVHLERLQKQHPSKRVVLITFNNEVTVYGDGTHPPVVIAGISSHILKCIFSASSPLRT
jgi:hypothetical protein